MDKVHPSGFTHSPLWLCREFLCKKGDVIPHLQQKTLILDYTKTNYYLMELQPVGVTVREGPSQVRSQLRGFNSLVERFHGSHNVHLGGAEIKRLNYRVYPHNGRKYMKVIFNIYFFLPVGLDASQVEAKCLCPPASQHCGPRGAPAPVAERWDTAGQVLTRHTLPSCSVHRCKRQIFFSPFKLELQLSSVHLICTSGWIWFAAGWEHRFGAPLQSIHKDDARPKTTLLKLTEMWEKYSGSHQLEHEQEREQSC